MTFLAIYLGIGAAISGIAIGHAAVYPSRNHEGLGAAVIWIFAVWPIFLIALVAGVLFRREGRR